MNETRRNALSAFLGVTLLAALLGLVVLDGLVNAEPPESAIVRQVALRDPPPPPPPPATRQDPAEEPMPELSSTREQLPIELTTMDLDLNITAGPLTGTGTGDWGDSIGVDLGLFDLEDLDGIPTVVRAPIIDDYPEALLERGIGSFEVMLHILVDETGRPFLIEVIASGYEPYNPNLESFVSDVRFTPPTVLGVPVRTEYAWPLLIRVP